MFRLNLNLSSFFNDHRSNARVFINNGIKTVEDLQNHIEDIFGITNFYLTSQNHYLPPTEDIRILQHDETICAIQTNIMANSFIDNGCKTKKNKCSDEEVVVPRKKKKRDRSRSISCEEEIVQPEDPPKKREKKKKKHKDKPVEAEENEITPIILSSIPLPITPKPKYVCKGGDLAAYKKKEFLKPNTDEYLQIKKNNVVKINVIQDTRICSPAIQPTESLNTSIENGITPMEESPTNNDEMEIEECQNEIVPEESEIQSSEPDTKIPDATTIVNTDPKDTTNIVEPELFASTNSESEAASAKKPSFLTKRAHSGIGFLLNYLKGDSSIINESLNESDANSTTATKRHRTRVRKRKKNSPESRDSSVIDEPAPVVVKPMKTEACPVMHIKFDEPIDVLSSTGSYRLSDSDINDTMNGTVTTPGDIVDESPITFDELVLPEERTFKFQIIKLSETFFPEVSDEVYASILSKDTEKQSVHLHILYGIEKLPPLEEDSEEDITTEERTYKWSELINPRLIQFN